MEELKQSSVVALRDYLGLKQSETLLIVSDETKREISNALLEAGQQLCSEAVLVEMKSREQNGQEPPQQIADMMKVFNVVICPTDKSLTHTKARRDAAAAGARVATMPGITSEMMSRCLNADAAKILSMTEFVAKKLEEAYTIHVTTAKGTDIMMPVKGRKVLKSTGILKKSGDWGNLPSGEVYLAPIEKQSYGKIVIDGSMAGIGMLDKPIIIDVKDGYAIAISGGTAADKLAEMLDRVGTEGRAVAEFGIGTNYKAVLTGSILEDEKVYGTVHIAFGNNLSMGGSIDVGVHLDGLICEPDVYINDKLLMSKGKLLDYEI